MAFPSRPLEVSVYDSFLRCAADAPDRIAIVCGDDALSYRALAAHSGRLARRLRERGLRHDSVVAINIERSPELMIAILGVITAGSAYLPLDPGDPPQRLSYVLEDSRAALVLATSASPALPIDCALPVVYVETGADARGLESEPEGASVGGITTGVASESGAYVIYTSGSTGRPKGVVISHAALVNHTAWMQAAFPLTASDVVLQKTPLVFDASVWELFSPLAAGARLLLAWPGAHRDPGYLVRTIHESAVTILQLVPTQLSALLAEPGVDRCTSLGRVFCGGEVLLPEMQERFFEGLPAAELVNLYGPTECTIDTTAWRCERDTRAAMVPIGRPIDQAATYVLDPTMRMSPIGVPGELYVGGKGLARGYLHRPALTAERFVPNPFDDGAGARLYRTGDLVRWNDAGALEYIGRVDRQVKLRGYRIELEEIEGALAEAPDVAQAVVVLRAGAGGEKLVAYVRTRAGQPTGAADLRDFLQRRLPSYMVPSAFVWLDLFPLMPNGKVDRARLPEPAPVSDLAYVAPRNPVEERVAGMWEELLGIERVSMTARFFELGGHSLLLIRLGARIRETFDVDVSLRELFNCPTVPDMVDALLARLADSEAGAEVQTAGH